MNHGHSYVRSVTGDRTREGVVWSEKKVGVLRRENESRLVICSLIVLGIVVTPRSFRKDHGRR